MNKPNEDRIMMAIGVTEDMLSRLKAGLMSGEPLQEMEKVARDMCLAATSIEVMVTDRRAQSRKKSVRDSKLGQRRLSRLRRDPAIRPL